MRLWHQDLIQCLDDKRLLGQHRECCALRGAGWGRKHSTVDYVFKHSRSHLYQYHCIVMIEMCLRGFSPDPHWWRQTYRGQHLPEDTLAESGAFTPCIDAKTGKLQKVYIEHDDRYLRECLENLASKHAVLTRKSVYELLVELDLREADKLSG